MSDTHFTLIEYHSHGEGVRFLPDRFGETTSESAESERSNEKPSGSRRLGPLLGLVVLVALAAGYQYYRSRGQDGSPESEQVAVTEYER